MPPAARHDVSFWHGMNRLVGDLVLPPWPGPHPVVVLAGGGGTGLRDQGGWLDRLAAAGIASLSWDRPGCGASTGDWVEMSPLDRAQEVLSGMQFLTQVADVQSGSVAVLGSDEGGWIGPLAAAYSASVAAVVMLSTPGVSIVPLEHHRLGVRLSTVGFSADEVALAQLVLHERWRRLAGGETPTAVHSAEAPCWRAQWYPYMPGTTAREIAAFGRDAGYDPRPALAGVRCPVLALYGGDDILLPVRDSVNAVMHTLRTAQHPDHEVVVVPGADHALRVYTGIGAPRLENGYHQPGEFTPGLTEFIITWLDQRIGRARQLQVSRGGYGGTPGQGFGG